MIVNIPTEIQKYLIDMQNIEKSGLYADNRKYQNIKPDSEIYNHDRRPSGAYEPVMDESDNLLTLKKQSVGRGTSMLYCCINNKNLV